MTQSRFVLIGYGTIGKVIARGVGSVADVALSAIVSRRPLDAETIPAGAEVHTDLASTLHDAQLVVEAATPDFVVREGERILTTADFLPLSLTALADDALRARLIETARRYGTTLFVPHGAVLGLDGLFDGRELIDEVNVTTIKHPRNLGLNEDRNGPMFEGSAREACARFPRNVNVHAAIALAGIGFDRTISRIVSDTSTTVMRHEIRVLGDGIDWQITVASRAASGVSGQYTPVSALGSVTRALLQRRRFGGMAIV